MPHLNDDPVVNPKFKFSPFHGKFTIMAAAGLPQLLTQGPMILDYFKSAPFVFFLQKNQLGDLGQPTTDWADHVAKASCLWLGGQALVVDILLSAFPEMASAVPYLRALVLGLAASGFDHLWFTSGQHGKYYEWIFNLYETNPTELGGLRSFLAFMLGFLGARGNVGAGPWSTGAHIGLATSSAMITTPYLFKEGTYRPYLTYKLHDYVKLIISYTMMMGLGSRILSSRTNPNTYALLMGALNAFMEHGKIQSLVFPYLAANEPSSSGVGGVPREVIPRSYTAY